MPRKPETIKGKTIAAPRITAAGYWLMLKYVAFPVLAVLTVLDVLLYQVFQHFWGMCYGIMCLL